jgi:hypothetical protein
VRGRKDVVGGGLLVAAEVTTAWVCTEDPEETAEVGSLLAAEKLPLVASGLAGADAVGLSPAARVWSRAGEGDRAGEATWRVDSRGERCGDKDRAHRPRGGSPDASPDMPAVSVARSEGA